MFRLILSMVLSLVLILQFPTIVFSITSSSTSTHDGSACPNNCGITDTSTIHGRCNMKLIATCDCVDQYQGPAVDCSERTCPYGLAWFDLPIGPNQAHTTITECSSRGTCNYKTGECECDGDFEGHACERSRCPGFLDGVSCSGHGICVSLKTAGLTSLGDAPLGTLSPSSIGVRGGRSMRTPKTLQEWEESPYYDRGYYGGTVWEPINYNEWDNDNIYGCMCDEGWTGRKCDEPVCPIGTDPLYRGNHEIQKIQNKVDTSIELAKGREVQKLRIDVQYPLTLDPTSTVNPLYGTGGLADVDEIQEVTFISYHTPPKGQFTLSIDCRFSTKTPYYCTLWEQKRKRFIQTKAISLDNNADPTVSAKNIKDALESLPEIGLDQITVIGTLNTDIGSDTRTLMFLITFTGDKVPGDIPLMRLQASAIYAPGGGTMLSTGIIERMNGTSLYGEVYVKWDPTNSYPNYNTFHNDDPACTEDTTDDVILALATQPRIVGWNITDDKTTVQAAITALIFGCPYPNGLPDKSDCIEVPYANAIEIIPHYAGGPWIEYTIYFRTGIQARGDIAPILYEPTLSKLKFRSITAPFLNVQMDVSNTEMAKGVFMKGTWSLSIPFYHPNGDMDFINPALGPYPWCVDATILTTALNGLDSSYGSGFFSVSRERVYSSIFDDDILQISTLAEALSYQKQEDYDLRIFNVQNITQRVEDSIWLGEYKWFITFQSYAEDISQLIQVTSNLQTTTNGIGLFTIEETRKGDKEAAINEVQIIDCLCNTNSDCTDPNTQGIRLTFMHTGNAGEGETTVFLPYSSTAADIRTALQDLHSIPDVIVNMYDYFSHTQSTMCDEDGTTTAITFAYNPGPQPPLIVYDTETLSHYTLPSNAKFSIKRAPSFGLYGGGHAKKGTRKLYPCSNRGECGTDGTCTCYDGFGISDNGQWPDAVPGTSKENGQINPLPYYDLRNNCGSPISTIITCPLSNGIECSGHGTCGGAPNYMCQCSTGYAGPACEYRDTYCYLGPAWFARPSKSYNFHSLYSSHTQFVWEDLDALLNNQSYTSNSASLSYLAHRPIPCSGHGTCGNNGQCTCDGDWAGKACQYAPCPGSIINSDESDFGKIIDPTAPTETLSDLGLCQNDRPCITLADYSQTLAKTEAGKTPEEELLAIKAKEYAVSFEYTGWDAHVLRGCVCGFADASPQVVPNAYSYQPYSGYDCSARTCPRGPDPQDPTTLHNYESKKGIEIQEIQCTLGESRIRINWRGASSRWIRWDTWVKDEDTPMEWVAKGYQSLETSLRIFNTSIPLQIELIETNNSTGKWKRLCNPQNNDGTIIRLYFLGSLGDVPLMEIEVEDTTIINSTSFIKNTEIQPGSIIGYECNRRGVCQRTGKQAGQCICQPQFGSSNGLGEDGPIGDCGYRNPFWGYSGRKLPRKVTATSATKKTVVSS